MDISKDAKFWEMLFFQEIKAVKWCNKYKIVSICSLMIILMTTIGWVVIQTECKYNHTAIFNNLAYTLIQA